MQTLPMIGALALFGTIAIVCCVIISLGPIAHVEQNSKTYSAIKPPRYASSSLMCAFRPCPLMQSLRQTPHSVLVSCCSVFLPSGETPSED